MRNPWLILLWVLASLCPHNLTAQDRIFLFPSGSSNLVSVLRASDLASVGSFQSNSAPFHVIDSFDGTKAYLFTRRATDSILVIDQQTLTIQDGIDLGASPFAAEITPDGRFLLVAAGNLHVIDTATDQPAFAPINVGGTSTKIVVDDASTRAYILAERGLRISVLNLATFMVETTLEVTNVNDIALSSDNSRLLAVNRDGVIQYTTTNFEEISMVAGNFPLNNATLHPLPDPVKVLVAPRGVAPANTAQLIDLDAQTASNIGDIGNHPLGSIAIIDSTRAYAVIVGTEDLAAIDFTTLPNPTVTSLPFGGNSRQVDLSPNRRFAFVSSLDDATMLRIDTATNTVTATINTPVAPAAHATVYGPTTLPPAVITVHGGDDQFLPPDTTLPVSYAARVVDAEGSPVRNAEVLFQDTLEGGLIFSPSPIVRTNRLGIASVTVTIPPDPPPTEAVQEELAARPTGSSANPEPNQAEPELLNALFVTATAAGVPPAVFKLTVIRAVGLVKVSGDNQVTNEGVEFPLPFLLLATDDEGRPLPTGTKIELSWSNGTCTTLSVPVDPRGFAEFGCTGAAIPVGGGLFRDGGVTASIPSRVVDLGRDLVFARFFWNVASGGTRLGIDRISPGTVTAQAGTAIDIPFQYQINSTFGAPIGKGEVAVTMTQLSGPPAIITPRVQSGRIRFVRDVFVTLGPLAGRVVFQAQASVPNLPSVLYTIISTGGVPVSLETEGDGQAAKASSTLPAPLRVRVRNESGELVPFPELTWRVVEGNATIDVQVDSASSMAFVTFGDSPGTVRIVAAIGNLQTTFNVTALPPEPAAISTFDGQNQTLTTSVLSDPLVVRVTELDNTPAAAAAVTWMGPPSVRLHPTDGSPPGNPIEVLTNSDGLASVRVELTAVSALGVAGVAPNQLARTVTVTASLGGQLATSFLLNVSGRTPQFESRGVVNAATFQGGIVPGSLVTIFGSGLMEGVIGAESAAGATSFNGTTVRIGGIPSPLLTLAAGPPEQINLQAPFGLIPGQTTTVEIENNGSRQTVGGVPVFSAQPGIFEIPLVAGGTVAAVLHAQTGTLVTPDNPAEHREALSVFFTGGGALNPPVPTGTTGPLSPSVATLPTIIGVDDKGAPVLFSGYAPGFLGLYQANFTVPEDARCGLRPISVRMGDTFSRGSTLAILCP